MSGLSPDLYNRCFDILLRCDAFTNNHKLGALFVDERVYPWKNQLPEASDRVGRVALVIDFLHDKYNDGQENALILLFYVLRDRIDARDARYEELTVLAQNIEHFFSPLFESGDRSPLPVDHDPRWSDAVTQKQVELMIARRSLVYITDPIRRAETINALKKIETEMALLKSSV